MGREVNVRGSSRRRLLICPLAAARTSAASIAAPRAIVLRSAPRRLVTRPIDHAFGAVGKVTSRGIVRIQTNLARELEAADLSR